MRKSFMTPLIIGLVAGILGTVFLPGYVRPYLPAWIAGKTVVVTGTVEAKQKQEHSLLLTVETPEGVLLATFTSKVDEINLLINVQDTVEFTLPKYLPFIEDPKIVRVLRGEQPVSSATVTAEKPKEQGAKEAKPKQRKPGVAVPAPKSDPTGTKAAK